MKRYLLFLIGIIICLIYLIRVTREPFVPCVPIDVPLGSEAPSPFATPYAPLVSPPPGQLASVNSYPATNPVFQKAPLKRVKEVREMLNGFLTYEAPGLLELDPETRTRLDSIEESRDKLDADIVVMQRNEGLESAFTMGDLNDMELAVAAFQAEWRLSPNAIEGFQDNSIVASNLASSPGPGMAHSMAGSSFGKEKVTLDQLKDILLKIDVEILRLS